MTHELDRAMTGWTVPLKEHVEALKASEDRLHAERDRRYAEVNVEKEKALKIKEEADKAALALAREIQTYKDEKANELRSQIERERGSYVTKPELAGAIDKIEATVKPIAEFVASQQGRAAGIGLSANVLVTILGLLLTATVIAIAIATRH